MHPETRPHPETRLHPEADSRAARPAPPTGHRPLRLLLLAILLAGAGAAVAQPTANQPASRAASAGSISAATNSVNLPSSAQLTSKLAEVGAATGLDEPTKAALTEQYRHALSNLEDADNFDAKAAQFADALKSAPKETAALQKQIDANPTASDPGRVAALSEGLSSEEIGQRLTKVLADVAVEETRISEFEKLIDADADRPTAARARLSELKQILDQLDADRQKAPIAGESADLAQARRWAVETRRKAATAESKMLEQELLSLPVRGTLFKARRDLAAQTLRTLKTLQQALEEQQSKQRTAEAEEARRTSEQAQREAEDKHPLVRQLTQQNTEITEALATLARQLDGFGDELTRIQAERKRIEDDFRGAKQRLDAAGLSKALGQVLIDRRSQLPDVRQYSKLIASREADITEAVLQQIHYREEERRLTDLSRFVTDLTANDPSARTPQVREQLANAAAQRSPLLAQALNVEDDYVRQLGELNYAYDQVIKVAESYDHFLAERLLWVRSATAVGLDSLRALPGALAWVVSPDGWGEVARALGERLGNTVLPWLGLAVVAALFWRISTLLRAIRATAEPLRRVRTDGVHFTLRAIGLTLLAALPTSLLFWLIGQMLLQSAEATAFTRAFGTAFSDVAFGLYYLRAFRLLCINGGVADRHFRWRSETLQRIRHDFDWFTLYIVPTTLIAIAIFNHNDSANTGSLGRLMLLASMVGFTVFFARLLNPEHGVLKRLMSTEPHGWLNRLRFLWYPLMVGSPLALGALALVGYVYTAAILFQSLVYQTWLALGLVVLHQSIVRWLIVTRRRLALQAALERQAARRAQAETERAESGGSELLPVEEPEPDLAALDEQTRRLINAAVVFSAVIGLWVTWSDVLPALTLLQRFALWHYIGTVDGSEQSIPVTAADVGLVLVITIVATVAAKNLPALLEILLLQSESVSAGSRYAIKTLSSYVITVGAFLLVFSTLGLSWSQVQWLVAALSVGIGFGLQEIVANFISGLIILFERPVRVGDIVTIGNTSGVVTNIQIRATTIRNWDKQELLVPNKEFITGRLLNWTLTDQQNRISITIGLEYGSDTRKALELLTEIAQQHERVLDDPPPLVSFEGFGDNALTVILRCYLGSIDGRIGVITELHQTIYDTFTRHGLLMAFPQRDIHLSASRPLDIRLTRGPRETPP